MFQTVIGPNWPRLGTAIRRHYFLRPHSGDTITVTGVMDEIHHSAIARLLIPFGRLFGGIVPYRGRDVPIAVHYSARPGDATIHWDRVFRFPGRKPFHFRSFMEPGKPNQVIEFVRFGLGIRLAVTAEDGALVFRDRGYIWRLFGLDVPLPMNLVFGRTTVEERPVDDHSFTMRLVITHPLFGDLFRYSGRFSLPPDQGDARLPHH
ncbi:MAG TPA: DUF4166 domain-containing protein [Inquilinus sp.]|nr:DUF4166 domain-containing protein [Inquilinus sp.]